MTALDRLGELDVPLFGTVPPNGTVDIYFNMSKLNGEDADEPGPALVGDRIPVTGEPDSLVMLGDPPAFMNMDDEKPQGAAAAASSGAGRRTQSR